MKRLEYTFFKHMLFAVLILAFGGMSAFAQGTSEKSDKTEMVKKMISAQRYVFKAQSVLPTRGRTVQLNSDYDLSISKDTVRAYLPYFGRAYSAPLDGKGGIDFTSKNFEYIQKDRKKGGWDISIKTKDANDIRELFLTIFENGSASLRVFSNNREAISYNGYIAEK